MKTYFLAFANALPHRDKLFNDWYNSTHLSEVTNQPGIISGQRFKLTNVVGQNSPRFQYLTLYEVESENSEQVMHDLMAAIPGMRLEPVVDPCVELLLARSVADPIRNTLTNDAD